MTKGEPIVKLVLKVIGRIMQLVGSLVKSWGLLLVLYLSTTIAVVNFDGWGAFLAFLVAFAVLWFVTLAVAWALESLGATFTGNYAGDPQEPVPNHRDIGALVRWFILYDKQTPATMEIYNAVVHIVTEEIANHPTKKELNDHIVSLVNLALIGEKEMETMNRSSEEFQKRARQVAICYSVSRILGWYYRKEYGEEVRSINQA
jgi:hypothetical protein